MKTALVATLFAVAATAATAQLAAPISPAVSPTVRADPAATAPEQAQLRADERAMSADREKLADANSAESLKR